MDPSNPEETNSEFLLAMDTSCDVCSVAVFRVGRLSAELTFRHEMHLSERLIGHVDELLSREKATVRDIDCFAVGVGPGSFTGTRIGVMTMKTFAFVRNKPLAVVNGLEAMAAEYSGLAGVIVTPVLACRRGVVYGCPFAVDTEVPTPLAEPGAYSFDELANLFQNLPETTVLFCGAAARSNEARLTASFEVHGKSVRFGVVEFPRASSIGRLAIVRRAAGAPHSAPLDVSPLYISPPPITLPKQPIPT